MELNRKNKSELDDLMGLFNNVFISNTTFYKKTNQILTCSKQRIRPIIIIDENENVHTLLYETCGWRTDSLLIIPKSPLSLKHLLYVGMSKYSIIIP